MAMILACLCVALTLMPLSTRTKDLGALDTQLAWLYCLPLRGSEILSGRFVSMSVVRPLAWIILLPFLSVLLWAMGYGLLGVAIAMLASLHPWFCHCYFSRCESSNARSA